MKQWIGIVVCVLSLVLAHGAGAESAQPQGPKWMASPVKEMVDKARAATKQVSIEELKKSMDSGEAMVVLDVREPNEYEAAHIPESVNLPRGLLEFNIWSLVPDKNEKIMVYCKTGARAALATRQLNELGYVNALAVATGGAAWVKAGYPVQTSITDEELVLLPVK